MFVYLCRFVEVKKWVSKRDFSGKHFFRGFCDGFYMNCNDLRLWDCNPWRSKNVEIEFWENEDPTFFLLGIIISKRFSGGCMVETKKLKVLSKFWGLQICIISRISARISLDEADIKVKLIGVAEWQTISSYFSKNLVFFISQSQAGRWHNECDELLWGFFRRKMYWTCLIFAWTFYNLNEVQ